MNSALRSHSLLLQHFADTLAPQITGRKPAIALTSLGSRLLCSERKFAGLLADDAGSARSEKEPLRASRDAAIIDGTHRGGV